MKLKLKHLAPYLPYGLKCYLSQRHVLKMNISGIGRSNISLQSVISNEAMPILCPLSDLTVSECEEVDFTLGGLSAYGINKCIQANPLQGNYHMLEYLYKNHYDVFGLIAKGLAIDINTLNN